MRIWGRLLAAGLLLCPLWGANADPPSGGLHILNLFRSADATPAATPIPTDPRLALHLLQRLGYGPRPGDIDRVVAEGADRYIEDQLHPERLPDPPELGLALASLPALSMGWAQRFQQFGPPGREAAQGDPAAEQQLRRGANSVLRQDQEARLLRALESPRQLQEVLVEFWFNHFNVYEGKGVDHVWVGLYERDAIRPHVFGHFQELLEATARSPAMLFYLDNRQSFKTGVDKEGHPRGPNENYARELMELHTLGVDGGYKQKDVSELARILTGWTYDPKLLKLGADNAFVFDFRRHDTDEKVFLHHHLYGVYGDEGISEGERALKWLAEDRATAIHLCKELAQYFLSETPPQDVVDAMVLRWRATDGDLREVLKTLFTSPEFRNPQVMGGQFKTPYTYVLSAVRAAGLHPTNVRPLLNQLQRLGMPPYGCPTPDGYKFGQSWWLNASAVVDRLSFATALGAGRLPLMAAPQPEPATATSVGASMAASAPAPLIALDAAALQATLGNTLSPSTQEAINSAPPGLRAGLLLGSPDFMRR